MLFFGSHLGAGPVNPGALNPFSTGGAAPVVASTSGAGVGTAIPEGTCTSDGKLVWSYSVYPLGAWHVVAPTETCKANSSIPSGPILAGLTGQPVYVGPFPVSHDLLSNSNWEITDFALPTQLPRVWADWIVSIIQAGNGSQNGSAWNVTAQASSCPLAQGGERQIIKPGGGGTLVSAFSLIPNETKVWVGQDDSGNACHYIQYVNDPNTYKFYNYCDWLNYFKSGWDPCIDADAFGNSPCLAFGVQGDLASLFQQLDQFHVGLDKGPAIDAMKQSPPAAKFVHPITGKTWGMWIGISSDTRLTGGAPAESGTWNSGSDRPAGFHLEVGFREMPNASIWDAIIDLLEWIPSVIAAVVNAVINTLQSLVCTAPAQAQALAKSQGPAGLAALAALQATCPGAQLPAVTQCPNGTLVPVGTACPTPWYLQWYTLLIAAGLVTVGVVHFARGSSHSTPAT